MPAANPTRGPFKPHLRMHEGEWRVFWRDQVTGVLYPRDMMSFMSISSGKSNKAIYWAAKQRLRQALHETS